LGDATESIGVLPVAVSREIFRLQILPGNSHLNILTNCYAQGATWIRRGLQNLWCMPRCGLPRKSIRKLIVANDDNYALAA